MDYSYNNALLDPAAAANVRPVELNNQLSPQ